MNEKQAPQTSMEGVRDVAHFLGVASSKGREDKTTVAINLALALAQLGYRVGPMVARQPEALFEHVGEH